MLAELTLSWARSNTLTLQVNDQWLQIALRVTDRDGPGKGNRGLLRLLIRNQVIIKSISEMSQPESPTPREE